MSKSPLIPTEHEEQTLLIQWAEMSVIKRPELNFLFAVPNGGLRNMRVAKQLKAEGVKKGVPDLMLLAPRSGYHGIVVEMKRRKGGRVELEQVKWLDWLQRQGYCTCVCKGFDAAILSLTAYLDEIEVPNQYPKLPEVN